MPKVLLLALLSLVKQFSYPGADFLSNQPIPKFDRGYLLFLRQPCELIVYQPSGTLLFQKSLEAPGGAPCSPADTAIDTDGAIAVSIGYSAPLGYAGGILLLDKTGKQTGFIDTKHYSPAHIAFGPDHSIWSIGWDRDEAGQGHASKADYALVRRYARTGAETGAFIRRSLWSTKGEPANGSIGFWNIAVAKDRIGSIVYENWAHRTAEWIEWDFNGDLLTRIPIPEDIQGGKAFTSSGKLYAGLWDAKQKVFTLSVLDRDAKSWKTVGQNTSPADWQLLLGADSDDLVFKSRSGAAELLWMRPEL